ncbi:MAG TPA: thiol-disulfide oxidoreductase DCC family protein [Segetibacter sp.]|jgi:predicted DCC family thiol-disulfide oxidoreductase YuxK
MDSTDLPTSNPIVLFDGVCNLCSSSVQYIIKRDKKNIFRFASLQSDVGQKLLAKYNLPTTELDSFVLVQNGRVYKRSTGALMVAKQLGGASKLLYGFIIIPAFIRDAVYTFIGNNRYKWFGKKEACWIPTPELRSKFLDTPGIIPQQFDNVH